MHIFLGLADNGLWGWAKVVGAKSRKWGYFRGHPWSVQCAERLVGLVEKISALF